MIVRLARSSGPGRPRVRHLLAVLVALGAAACAGLGIRPGTAPGDADSRFQAAIEAMDRGEYQLAAVAFRSLATRCASGSRGREAVLTLAALELDPRGGSPSPTAGAQLSARYLQIPSAPPESLPVAESLYLLALDLGARPVQDPFGPVSVHRRDVNPEVSNASSDVESWRVAPRFRDCLEEGPDDAGRALPVHPGLPLWAALERVWEERNALTSRTDSLARAADSLERAYDRALIVQDSLEAEIARIRELVRQGVGSPPNQSRAR